MLSIKSPGARRGSMNTRVRRRGGNRPETLGGGGGAEGEKIKRMSGRNRKEWEAEWKVEIRGERGEAERGDRRTAADAAFPREAHCHDVCVVLERDVTHHHVYTNNAHRRC